MSVGEPWENEEEEPSEPPDFSERGSQPVIDDLEDSIESFLIDYSNYWHAIPTEGD